MKIQKIKIDIEFSDGSTTFENFVKASGAKEWLEAWEMKMNEDEEKVMDLEKEPDAYVEKESEKGIM